MENLKIKLLIVSILTIFYSISFSQSISPVKWSTKIENIKKDQAELVITATIDKGWHLYSQFLPAGGPIKTTFNFNPSADFSLNGGVSEGDPIAYYDKNFEMNLKYFSDQAEFRQKIKLSTKKDFQITGNVEYMVCDDEKCLPPVTVDLTFNVKL